MYFQFRLGAMNDLNAQRAKLETILADVALHVRGLSNLPDGKVALEKVTEAFNLVRSDAPDDVAGKVNGIDTNVGLQKLRSAYELVRKGFDHPAANQIVKGDNIATYLCHAGSDLRAAFRHIAGYSL